MLIKTATVFQIAACVNLMWVAVMADRVVMTNNGPIQGITVSSGTIKIEGFLGIPYAEPPLGRLRFQKPVPKTPWIGVYDASSLPPPCSQNGTSEYYWAPVLDNMTENCLYLNMWVPYSKKPTRLKPVLIYLHGGAFNIGSSNMKVYDGTTLAKRGDIIVITLNYRVGVLGFFTSLTDDAVGNVGLHDQITALRWVKENVKSFGGDPDQMVLMGNSAGAMAIAGHIASPLTKNLFKRAILQSGGGIQTMILDENKRLIETSQKLATMLGCADKKLTIQEYPRIVVQCLKRLSDKALVAAEGILMKKNPLSFYPRVGDDYLPKPVIYLLREGDFQDMEMLLGMNAEEGNLFLTVAIPQYFGVYGINNVKTISKRLAKQLIGFIFKNTEQTEEQEIADFYSESIKNGTSDAYTKVIGQSLGDYFISCNAFYQAEFYSMRNPVYFYLLTHHPSSTVLADWMGTTHFDEVQYTFGNPLFDNFTEEEAKLSHRMMDRWIAFTKTGNPNIPNEIEWPKFTVNNTEYLNIDIEETIGIRPDNYRCEFWRERFEAGIDDEVIVKMQLSSSAIAQVFPLLFVFSLTLFWILGRSY